MSKISSASEFDSPSSQPSQNSSLATDSGWDVASTEFDQKLAKQRLALLQTANLKYPLSLILSKYQVELEPIVGANGWTMQCCCPFPDHSERTPSFYFNTEEERFNCFGCHRGGKAVEFIAVYEGISRIAAAEKLTQGYNPTEIQIQVVEDQTKVLQEKMFELSDLAREIYKKEPTKLMGLNLEKVFETLDIHLRVFESEKWNTQERWQRGEEFQVVLKKLGEMLKELINE